MAAVLAGEPLPEDADIDAQLNKTMREWKLVEDAKQLQSRNIDAVKKAAGRKLCESLKPEHDKLMKKACAALTEAHSASTSPDLYEVLGAPNDSSSHLRVNIRTSKTRTINDRHIFTFPRKRAGKMRGKVRIVCDNDHRR